MRILEDICISTVNIPDKLEVAYGFDYNTVLNLYASFNGDDGLAIWDSLSGKVVAEFNEFDEVFRDAVFRDTLFLPGNRVGVSSSLNMIMEDTFRSTTLEKTTPKKKVW